MSRLGRVGAGMAVVFLALSWGAAWAAPTPQSTERIVYGETVEGMLDQASSEQMWTFTGANGDVVLIEMQAVAGSQLDPLLTLLDATGSTLASDDDSGPGLNARIGPYTLPTGGAYTIVASRYAGAGDYRLSLSSLNTVPCLAMLKGVHGEINAETPAEYYLVQADAGEPELVSLSLNADDYSSSPQLQVYGADGQLVLSDPNASDNPDVLLLLPDERYVVAVSQTDDGGGGPYQLLMKPADAVLLADGVPQRGQLAVQEDVRRHYFVGERGDVVRVTLEAAEGVLPALSVRQESSDTVLFSSDGSAVSRFSVTLSLPADGGYQINIAAGKFAPDEGAYTLTVDWESR